jgi:hypothetical protein
MRKVQDENVAPRLFRGLLYQGHLVLYLCKMMGECGEIGGEGLEKSMSEIDEPVQLGLVFVTSTAPLTAVGSSHLPQSGNESRPTHSRTHWSLHRK